MVQHFNCTTYLKSVLTLALLSRRKRISFPTSRCKSWWVYVYYSFGVGIIPWWSPCGCFQGIRPISPAVAEVLSICNRTASASLASEDQKLAWCVEIWLLAKTIEYANCKDFDKIMTYYADDYIFHGPVVSPITAEDVQKTLEVSSFFWSTSGDMISFVVLKPYPQSSCQRTHHYWALKSNPHIPTCKHDHLDLLSIRTIHTNVISLKGGRALIPRA